MAQLAEPPHGRVLDVSHLALHAGPLLDSVNWLLQAVNQQQLACSKLADDVGKLEVFKEATEASLKSVQEELAGAAAKVAAGYTKDVIERVRPLAEAEAEAGGPDAKSAKEQVEVVSTACDQVKAQLGQLEAELKERMSQLEESFQPLLGKELGMLEPGKLETLQQLEAQVAQLTEQAQRAEQQAEQAKQEPTDGHTAAAAASAPKADAEVGDATAEAAGKAADAASEREAVAFTARETGNEAASSERFAKLEGEVQALTQSVGILSLAVEASQSVPGGTQGAAESGASDISDAAMLAAATSAASQARPGSRSGELEQLRQRVDGLELRVAALEAAPRPGEAAEVAPQEAPIAQPGAELHAQDGGTEVEGGKKDQAVDMKEQEQEKEKEEDTKDEADRNQVEDRREEQNRSNEDDSNEEARNGSKKEHQEPAEDPGTDCPEPEAEVQAERPPSVPPLRLPVTAPALMPQVANYLDEHRQLDEKLGELQCLSPQNEMLSGIVKDVRHCLKRCELLFQLPEIKAFIKRFQASLQVNAVLQDDWLGPPATRPRALFEEEPPKPNIEHSKSVGDLTAVAADPFHARVKKGEFNKRPFRTVNDWARPHTPLTLDPKVKVSSPTLPEIQR